MPNTGHLWTEQEKADALALDYPEFAAAYPSISFHSWRHKRRDLVQEASERANAYSGLEIPAIEPGTYVGPSIAFFDLETTYSTQPRILTGAIADGFGRVTLFDLKSHEGKEWIDDSVLAVAIRDELEKYTIIAGWNSKMFDVPVLNGRLAYHGERRLQPQLHLDMMYYASGQFMRIGRRSLESVSTYFSSPNSKTPLSPMLWDRADHGDEDAYNLIREHNIADVLVTRDVFPHLAPFIKNLHA